MDIRKRFTSVCISVLSAVLPATAASVSVQVAVPPGRAWAAPVAPTVTEPSADGLVVSGADVHMETAPMRQNDAGDVHLCTDWEIWTSSPVPVERVWFAGCIGGTGRVHVHLGDGVFENSHAGRKDLIAGRGHELRVRHRDTAGAWGAYARRPFLTDTQRDPLPGASEWRVAQSGYVVEEVADDFRLPVNIAMVPNHSGDPAKPLFYVTELYGRIRVVTGNFKKSTYADDVLNFDPDGRFPGSGEMGLTGIVVDPTSGDVFASMLYKDGDKRYPKVVRFHSTDSGFTASGKKTILDMGGAPQEASHQISNLTIGPDGKLYVHMGDGFEPDTAKDLDSFRGKVLRVNLDGSAPTDNPFYKASDGIKARDYVYAYGFRNPFGGAWRVADGKHYEVENGPGANDRLARVTRGGNYHWGGGASGMKKNALYNWETPHAPVNITFTEPEVFHAAGFPQVKHGNAFVSESGPTWASGPQSRGKRIVEFVFDKKGSVSDPKTLVEYNGDGKETVAGLTAGPDGLYFTGLYPKRGDATDSGAKIYRVRYVPKTTAAPVTVFQSSAFRGDSQGLPAGVFDATKGEFGRVANDTVSSLRVAGGLRAVACANSGTAPGGLGRCHYYGPGEHSSVGALNDQISLISVHGGPSPGNGVVAYRDANLAGPATAMGSGVYEAMTGELDQAGEISSLKVAPGYQAVACEHDRSATTAPGHLGLCRLFPAGEHTTLGGLDNKIALLAVAGPPLVVYADAQYKGTSAAFSPGIHDGARTQLGAVGNDAISSLRLAPGHRLVACQNDSLTGAGTANLGLCRYYGPGEHTFGGGDLDNQISLLAVSAGPGIATSTGLTAYQHSDLHGSSSKYGAGIHEASKKEIGKVGNDAISSLRVAATHRAVACEHSSGAARVNTGSLGLCRFYGPGDHQHVGPDLNDAISLIAVSP